MASAADLEGLEDVRFTPIETRIMDILSDGKLHNRKELLACIDDMAIPQNVYDYVSSIRSKIRESGYIITVMTHGRQSPKYILSKSIADP